MRRVFRVLFVAAMTLGLIPTFVECEDATQMIVEVTTDVPCDQFGGTSISVGSVGHIDPANPATAVPASSCKADGTVGSLVIVPSSDDDGELAFQVTTGIGVDPSSCTQSSADCIIARRQLRYIPHETIRIQVPMKQVCQGVSCDPSSTCFSGRCVGAAIDQSKCAAGVCGESSLGPPTATQPDAGAPDTGSTPPPTTTNEGGIIDAGNADAPPFGVSDIDIAFGQDHTCMLLISSGQVYCWGRNLEGQLGNPGGGSNSGTPARVTGLPGVSKISLYENKSGALDADGGLWLWGENGNGLIPNQPGVVTAPVLVSGSTFQGSTISHYSNFCLGRDYVCGVGTAPHFEHLECYSYIEGASPRDQFPVTPFNFPAAIDSLQCGDARTIVRLIDNTMWSFGGAGEDVASLGRGMGADASTTPVMITGMGPILSAASGPQDTIASQFDAATFGWGTNQGSLFNGNDFDVYLPLLQGAASSHFTKVVVGYLHACGIEPKTGGGNVVSCWGDNNVLQLGAPPQITRSAAPRAVDGLPASPVKSLFGGGNHNCVQVDDTNVYCWGANDHGQLGIGSIGASAGPSRVLLP